MDKLLHLGNTIAVFMIFKNFLQKILNWNLIVRGIGVQPISLSHRIFWIENVRFRLRVKASKLEFHWIENNNGLQLLSILFLIQLVFSLLLLITWPAFSSHPPSIASFSFDDLFASFSLLTNFWPDVLYNCLLPLRLPKCNLKTIEVVAQQFSNNVIENVTKCS